jgi:hypothetical protein
MNWTVEQCIEKFQLMCRTAFTLRKGASFYGVGALVEYYNHSKYETRPLEKTLKEAFTDNEYLFGGPKRDTTSRIKVAVTATSLTGNTAIVFGNYNRLCSEKSGTLLISSRPRLTVNSTLSVPTIGTKGLRDEGLGSVRHHNNSTLAGTAY